MRAKKDVGGAHPAGEPTKDAESYPASRKMESFGGVVEVEWEEDGAAGLHGGLVYFIEFLKVSGLWDRFVRECPLEYVSPNAPTKSEILGTILFSVLSGHRRYAHITGIRSDGVLPKLLGISRFRSEDSIRRAFEKQDEDELTLWMDRQMDITYSVLLRYEWVLDLDATVKTLYGRQEEAKVGYNPHKPGRPSHAYHAMLLSAARLVLNVDVEAGNHTASAYGMAGVWGWLDARHKDDWPTIVRGDIGYGNEEAMVECERRALGYVFKLRQSQRVGELLGKLASQGGKVEWASAGKGWQGVSQSIQLQGWSRERRVIVMRRKLERARQDDAAEQLLLGGVALEDQDSEVYEHSVLVTNWAEKDMFTLAQMYRDRADAENIFDELKNQWGWTGFATQDLKRSRLMARMVALIYNWWSIYTRMATGARHGEAISTRPLLQQAVVRRLRHANQTKLVISSVHGKARAVAHALDRISGWLRKFVRGAEQLEPPWRWGAMVVRIFEEFAGFRLGNKSELVLLEAGNCRI